MLHDVINNLREQTAEQQDLFVKGYGRLSLDTARSTSINRLEKAIETLKNGDEMAWKNAYHILYGSGVLEEILKAAMEADGTQSAGMQGRQNASEI